MFMFVYTFCGNRLELDRCRILLSFLPPLPETGRDLGADHKTRQDDTRSPDTVSKCQTRLMKPQGFKEQRGATGQEKDGVEQDCQEPNCSAFCPLQAAGLMD